ARAGHFACQLLSATLRYAAEHLPEIADSILSVDNAMKWGFNWELGPFETWDALGVESVVRRLEKDGERGPPLVREILSNPTKTFYARSSGKTTYFDVSSKQQEEIVYPKGILFLTQL